MARPKLAVAIFADRLGTLKNLPKQYTTSFSIGRCSSHFLAQLHDFLKKVIALPSGIKGVVFHGGNIAIQRQLYQKNQRQIDLYTALVEIGVTL